MTTSTMINPMRSNHNNNSNNQNNFVKYLGGEFWGWYLRVRDEICERVVAMVMRSMCRAGRAFHHFPGNMYDVLFQSFSTGLG